MMASSNGAFADEDGHFEDWIELHNPTGQPVNLGGWGISDNPAIPFKWVFPEVTVAPGGFLVVWASGKDRRGDTNAPIAPTEIPGLVGWFRNTGHTNNESVAQWSDHSGIGNHATQAVASKRPTFHTGLFNGEPAIRFDGASQDLELPRAGFSGLTNLGNLTVTSAVRWHGKTVSGIWGVWDGPGTSGNAHFEIQSGGALRLRIAGMNGIVANGAVASNTWTCVSFTTESATQTTRLFRDGVQVGASAQASGTTTLSSYGIHAIGRSHTDRFLDGEIAGFAMYNRPLSDMERRDVERWIMGESRPVELHTNFRISADGEHILLTRPDGQLADELQPTFVPRNHSLGRRPDASGPWLFFAQPTPGSANTTQGFSEVLAPPSFSHARGFYEQPFELSLAGPDGATIYFTDDGSEPQPGVSDVYQSPVLIDKTTVIRALAWRTNTLPAPAVGHSYIFLEQVLDQPVAPAGFPSHWRAWTNVHYAMTPEVVAPQRAAVRQALLALPTLSLALDVEDMFGWEGIYSNPERRTPTSTLQQVEKPVSMELLYPDGRSGFQANCGLRIQGGASRTPANNPKHSLRLLFKTIYGPHQLTHPLIPESSADSFNTVILRGEYNNSWIHWDPAQRLRGNYARDAWLRKRQEAMSGLGSESTYVHLYINGLYWGVYNPSERPDASFAATHLGGEKEDYDAVTHRGLRDGSLDAWNQMLALAQADLSLNANYLALGQMLDIPHFIDYMLVNLYGGNHDWPHNNWSAVRKRDGGRFQFICWDAERTLEVSTDNRTTVTDHPVGMLYSRLRANREFRVRFGDHIHRHFFNDGELVPVRAVQTFHQLSNFIEPAMLAESARWGTYRRDVHVRGEATLYTYADHWIAERNRLLGQYLPIRTGVVLNQFRAIDLYPSVDAPQFSRHGGKIDSGFLLGMSAPVGTIYYTTNGTDPRVFGTESISPSALPYTAPVPLHRDTIVKARVLAGGGWSALNEASFEINGPETFALGQGAYRLDSWDENAAAGSYPSNMMFFQTATPDPALEVEMDSVWTLPYNLTSRSRINGMGTNGFAFINTDNPQAIEGAGYLGAAVLALNTLGETNIQVRWTGGTVLPNTRVYAIRLQYRVGNDGAFIDVQDAQGNPVQYTRNTQAGHSAVLGPVTLPVAANNQPRIELRWKYHYLSGASGARAQLRVNNILVTSGAALAVQLAIIDAPPTAQAGRPLRPVTVEAQSEFGQRAASFSGLITVSAASGAHLTGTLMRPAISGVAVFDDLVFSQSGLQRLAAASNGLTGALSDEIVVVALTELLVPGYIQGEVPENTHRVPFAFRLQLAGLRTNATYRYANRVVTVADSATQDGAGNMILVKPAGNFVRTTESPRFQSADLDTRHGTFVTDNSGSYAGWFITEPSGNARFTPGNALFVRLLLNDGADGQVVHHFLTAPSAIAVTAFGGGAGQGSALYAVSPFAPRNFAVLFADAAGGTRPLAATPVEATGAAVDDRYASFYETLVAGIPGRWGALLPNGLPAGAQRIEERDLLTGQVISVFTSPTGHRPTTGLADGAVPVGIRVPGAGDTGFSIWQARQFSLAELADQNVSGALASPALDGIANLFKYAVGLDAFAHGADGLPMAQLVETNGTRHLRFQHRRLPGASDIIYTVELSANLDHWLDASDELFVAGVEPTGDGVTETVTLLLPIAGAPEQRFLRLRVTHSNAERGIRSGE